MAGYADNLIFRLTKGSPLTNVEGDANLTAIAVALDAQVPRSLLGAAFGVAQLDGSQKLAQRLKMAAGTNGVGVRDAMGDRTGKSTLAPASATISTGTNFVVIRTGMWNSNQQLGFTIKGKSRGNQYTGRIEISALMMLLGGATNAEYTNEGSGQVVVTQCVDSEGYACLAIQPFNAAAPQSAKWGITQVEVIDAWIEGVGTNSPGDPQMEGWAVRFETSLSAYTQQVVLNDTGWKPLMAQALAGVSASFPIFPNRATGEDANNWVIPGLYPIAGASVAATIANLPPGAGAGVVIVYPVSATAQTAAIQIYQRSDARYCATRRMISSTTWNDWEANLTTSTGVNLGGQIANDTDLNTVTQPGSQWCVSQNAQAATMTNMPPGYANAFSMEVLLWSASPGPYVMQRMTAYNAPHRIFIRAQNSATTWTAWYEIPTFLVGGTLALAQIPSIPTTKVTGTLPVAQIPTGIPQANVTNLTSDLALKAPVATPVFTGAANVGTDVNQRGTLGPGHVDLKNSTHGGFVDLATADATDFDWRIKNDSSGTTLGSLSFTARNGALIRFHGDGNIYSSRLLALALGSGYVADAISSLNTTLNAVKARTDGGNGLVHTLTGNTIDQYWNGTGVVVRIDGNGASDRRFWDTATLPNPATTAVTADLYTLVGNRIVKDNCIAAGFYAGDKLRPFIQHTDGTYVGLPQSSGVWRVAHGGTYVEILASDSVARGVTYNVSDLRKKRNVELTEWDALADLARIKWYKFQYRVDSGFDPVPWHHGPIAQDMRDINPNFVAELSDGTLIPNLQELVYLSLRSNEQLRQELNALKIRVQELESGNV